MTNQTSSALNAMFGFNKTNTNTNTQEVKEMNNSNLGYEMNEVVEHVKIGASVVGIWATATVVDSATVLGCAFGMSLQGGAGAVSLGNGFVPLIAVGNLLLASAVATAPVVLCGFVLSPFIASVFPNSIASLLNVEVEPTAWKAVAEARTKEILIALGYEKDDAADFAKLLINPEGWAKENVVISPIPKFKAKPVIPAVKTVSKTKVNLVNASAEMVKNSFDSEINEGMFYSAKPDFSKTFSNNVLEKTVVAIDYESLTLTIVKTVGKNEGEPEVFTARNYVALVFYGTTEDDRLTGLYDGATMLKVVANLIDNCKYVIDVKNLINKLASKIFVDRPEQSLIRGKDAYGTRAFEIEAGHLDQQQVITEHKISLLEVQSLGNNFVFGKATPNNFEPKGFDGTELEVLMGFFTAIGEPVFTDKNANKYFIYGDGARACGVDLVGGVLTTLNPIPRENGIIKNGAKILNRFTSYNFKKADELFLSINGEIVSGVVHSNLAFGLSKGYVKGAGVSIPRTFVSLGRSLANGIMETNKANDVRFVFEQTKIVSTKTISLNSLSDFPEYNFTEESAVKVLLALKNDIEGFIAEWSKTNTVLKAHNLVKFKGLTILENRTNVDYVIDNTSKEHIKVRLGSADYNGKTRSISIEVKALVESDKVSPKVRGLGKKQTAYQTETIIINEATGLVEDWNAIIDPNCIKTSAAILDIMSNDPEFINTHFEWSKGVLKVDGVVKSEEEVVAWVEGQLSTYIIKRPVDAQVEAYFKQHPVVGVEFKDGYMIEQVRGFFGNSVMEVEVSTADENDGVSRLGANEQVIASLINSQVSDRLKVMLNTNVSKANLLLEDASIPIFRLPGDRAALTEALTVKVESKRTKNQMNALAQKNKAIVVEWVIAKANGEQHTWSVRLPFNLLVATNRLWDEAGNPVADVAKSEALDTEEKVRQTASVADEVFDFISVVSKEELSDVEVRDLFNRSNLIQTWVDNQSSAKVANRITKAGKAHHQKVIGDLTIPNILIGKYDFPVIRIHPENSIVKNSELDKLVKEGLAVREVKGTVAGPNENVNYRFALLNRCPLPLFTAVVVEFDDTLDKSVIAVNPLVWIKSNFGDFDGDLAYLTDCSQFGTIKPETLGKFNENYSPLSVSKEGGRVIREEVLKVGEAKNCLPKEWTQINNRLGCQELVEVASNVHDHYKNAVGSFYRVAEALTLTKADKGVLTEPEIEAIIKAWILYEQQLGGWSLENADKVSLLKAETNKFLDRKEFTSAYYQAKGGANFLDLMFSIVFSTSADVSGLSAKEQIKARRQQNVNSVNNAAKDNNAESIDSLIIVASAGLVIARDIQSGKRSPEGYKSAVEAHAVSLISRKNLCKNEERIINFAGKTVVEGSRFSNAIKTIGALRAQVKFKK